MSWLRIWDLWKTRWQMVVKVDLHHEDQETLAAQGSWFLSFRAWIYGQGYLGWNYSKESLRPWEDALLETWEGQFENVADHTDDAKTLFFVELMHADFRIDLKIGEENEKIEVIRLAVSTFAWHAAHCLQCARLDFGWRCAGWFASCWWLGRWWLVARHICYADACPQTGKSHSTRHDWPSGRSFTQRATCLSSRIDWQVGSLKGAATLERLQNWPLYDSVQTSWHHTLHLDSTACRRSDLLE